MAGGLLLRVPSGLTANLELSRNPVHFRVFTLIGS
jgi:hypothetical protein